jgi:virginiamycin A acetyltransferase
MPRLHDARLRHPMPGQDGTAKRPMAHLASAIDHPNITVGDRPDANGVDPPPHPTGRPACDLYRGAPERLVSGRFSQITHGVRFVTAGANHDMAAIPLRSSTGRRWRRRLIGRRPIRTR